MNDSPDRPRFTIGVDFGTNNCRALVVDVRDGAEAGTAVYDYRRGDKGILLRDGDPNLARQSPRDYIDGFVESVGDAVRRARDHGDFAAERVVGIGIDTTGSTPIPVDREGTPLAFDPDFEDDLAAQAWLWKDHTAHAEAAEITEKGRAAATPYLGKCGGTYSSEWYWSKILRCRRASREVFAAAHSWVEAADFVPGWITGNRNPETMARGICPAGHKALYGESWGGLPDADFLGSLDPELVPLRERYRTPALTADRTAGELLPGVAEEVGLPADIAVAVGTFDAHAGGVGAGIEPGRLVKIIGTSTCDMMVAPGDDKLPDIPGLCGIVPGSIVPGMYGLEAGQSAVGDIFNWFVDKLAPVEASDPDRAHDRLAAGAAQLRPGESGLLALDWNNGNRTILVDPLLSGLLVGQTLHTTAAEIYRALIEGTAFGALTIIHRFEEYGVQVRDIVACGGVAGKNDLLMQIYADVTGRPIRLARSGQTCALGAAIYAAVAGGAHDSVPEAQAAMTGLREGAYEPDPDTRETYRRLFELYSRLHDAFGKNAPEPVGDVMKELIALRAEVRGEG